MKKKSKSDVSIKRNEREHLNRHQITLLFFPFSSSFAVCVFFSSALRVDLLSSSVFFLQIVSSASNSTINGSEFACPNVYNLHAGTQSKQKKSYEIIAIAAVNLCKCDLPAVTLLVFGAICVKQVWRFSFALLSLAFVLLFHFKNYAALFSFAAIFYIFSFKFGP